MKAIVCREFGPVANLELEDRPEPQPADYEVQVAIKAAGINFPDLLTVQGKYQDKPDLPFVPGNEIAGTISAVGSKVTTWAVGERVFATLPGGAFAEQCVAHERALFKMGTHMSFEQAAGLGIAYGTSYHALKQRAKLRAGECVLVLGAAGGVGVAAIQLAKIMGASVIAAASSEEKLDFACNAGADLRINYATENLKDRAKELTGGKGVDVVYDPVGGDMSEQAFRAIGWDGRYLVVGFAAGTIPKLPLNLTLLKGASAVGVFWGNWARRFPEDSAANFRELVALVDSGKLEPQVSEIYSLDRFQDAFRCIAERRAMGKLVLSMT